MENEIIEELQEYAVIQMEEIEKLKQQLQNSRIVCKKPNIKKRHIKISERLVFLSIISQEYNERLLKDYSVLINGGQCLMKHTSYTTYLRILRELSQRLSVYHHNLYGEEPHILNSTRSNLYYEELYWNGGDNVIFEYLDEKPLHTWNIKWDWKPI